MFNRIKDFFRGHTLQGSAKHPKNKIPVVVPTAPNQSEVEIQKRNIKVFVSASMVIEMSEKWANVKGSYPYLLSAILDQNRHAAHVEMFIRWMYVICGSLIALTSTPGNSYIYSYQLNESFDIEYYSAVSLTTPLDIHEECVETYRGLDCAITFDLQVHSTRRPTISFTSWLISNEKRMNRFCSLAELYNLFGIEIREGLLKI